MMLLLHGDKDTQLEFPPVPQLPPSWWWWWKRNEKAG